MNQIFVASTSRGMASRDHEERPALHNVPLGLESEFNRVTEKLPLAVSALLDVFSAHNVECDPRNRSTLLRHLFEMRITGQALVTALNEVCGGDCANFAEQVFSRSPQLARQVHELLGVTTFDGRGGYFSELSGETLFTPRS